jgi:hypothetical protein
MKIEDTGEEAIKAVEKVLGTPFGLEYQDHVLKTRRNLLIAGAVAVVFCLAGLKIEAPTPTTCFGPQPEGILDFLAVLARLPSRSPYLGFD